MNIGQAVAALGIEEPDDRDLPIVIFREGRPVHSTLRQCRDRDIADYLDLYVGSGLFARGSIKPGSGRTQDNLKEILRLPFDADLSDYLGCEKAELYDLPDDALDRLLTDQQADLEAAFAACAVPIHQLDRTGYGLCAYLRIDPAIAGEVEPIRAAHRRLIARLNQQAGFQLVDPQVSDAGTRITRLPPCVNTKGSRPRPSRTLYQREGSATATEMAPGAPERPRMARIIPDHGATLTEADAAAIVAALKPCWTLGQKHTLSVGFAGMMAKAGVPEPQAVAMMEAVSIDDEKPWDRLKSVATTYGRVRLGNDVRGYYTMRDYLPADVVEEIDRRLGGLRQATAGRIIRAGVTKRAEPPTKEGWPDLPAVCLRGPIGDYVRLASPTTEASDAFLLGAWLSVLASSCGRRVMVKCPKPMFANLFMALVGRTGVSRKDYSIDLAMEVVRESVARKNRTLIPGDRRVTSAPFGVVTDIASAQGLVKHLDEIAANLVVRLREMSTLLDKMRQQGTTTIADKCIELWDPVPSTTDGGKREGRVVAEPYLNIIAGTQPERLTEKMKEGDVTSGFANRWIYIFGDNKGWNADPPDLDMDAAVRLYADFMGNLELAEGKTLVLTPEAKARFGPWYIAAMEEAERDPVAGPLRPRCQNMAGKIALLYALADGAFAIEDQHLEAAIALVDWSWSIIRRSVGGWGASDEIKLEQRIESVLEGRGPMKKWKLQAQCRNRSWPQSLFHRVVDSMLKNGSLVRLSDNGDELIALISQVDES